VLTSNRLVVLLEIARAGTIVGAAESLHLTPSAVSHQLSRLEQEIGVALVERGPRSIRLTHAGRRLADHAQRVADALLAAEQELGAHAEGRKGLVRVAFFASSGLRLLPRAMSRFAAKHPGADIDLVMGAPHEVAGRLEAGELDLAVVFQHPLEPWEPPPSIDLEPLFTEPQLLVTSRRHRLNGEASVQLRELRAESWIATFGISSGVSSLEHACARAGFQPKVRCRSDHYEVTLQLVRAGLGIALVPFLGLNHAHGVHTMRLREPDLDRRISAALRGTNANPLALRVLDEMRTAAAEISREIDQLPAP
jgi:DNA-binding transcriptional LysR family regulator